MALSGTLIMLLYKNGESQTGARKFDLQDHHPGVISDLRASSFGRCRKGACVVLVVAGKLHPVFFRARDILRQKPFTFALAERGLELPHWLGLQIHLADDQEQAVQQQYCFPK